MGNLESFHYHPESNLRTENKTLPETKEQKLFRKEKEQRRIEQTASRAGKIESEELTANFEKNLPQLLEMAEGDDLDESHFEEALQLSSKPSGIHFQNSLSNVESLVKTKVLNNESKGLVHKFELNFRKLSEKYNAKLNITDLSQHITITDSLLQTLIPENTKLREKIQESLKNKESVTAKELLATVIFQEIIEQKDFEINKNIQNLHIPKETTESQNEQTHAILVSMGIRQKGESESEVLAMNIDDFKNLNTQLNSLGSPEERHAFLQEFVHQMSEAVGMEPSEYQSELESIMTDIQGLEILKHTFYKLENTGKLEDIVNDDGTLNTELFTAYYQESAQTVFKEFEAFENTTTSQKEEQLQTENVFSEIRVLSKEEARNNPVIHELLNKNPLIETHFMKENSVIRLHETENGNREIELVLAKENTEHGLSIKIEEQTGKSTIFIADIKFTNTDVTDERTFQRDLNSASANHLILDELNFPYSVFIDEQVDTKDLKGVNDPLNDFNNTWRGFPQKCHFEYHT